MQTNVLYLKGDIILTKGTTWLSKAIRRLTQDKGELITQVNHAGIIVSPAYSLEKAVIVEALLKVRRHIIHHNYGKGHSEIAVFRPVTCTSKEIYTIINKAESYVGNKYGFLKLILHLLDWCIGGRYFFRRIGKMDRFPICSYLVAKSFSEAGKDFGVPDRSASPDDIWDFCVNSKHYREVRTLSPYPNP